MNQIKITHIKLFLLALYIPFFVSCGRKSKNIFSFDKQNVFKVNILSLPAPQNIELKKENNKTIITWNPITTTTIKLKSDSIKTELINDEKEIKLIGYNIYSFNPKGFIPNEPLNKKALNENYFEDAINNKESQCYLIRGVFECQEKIYQGPTSKIVCNSDLNQK